MGAAILELILNCKPLGFHYSMYSSAVVPLMLLKILVWIGPSTFPTMHEGSRRCIEQKEAEQEHKGLF